MGQADYLPMLDRLAQSVVSLYSCPLGYLPGRQPACMDPGAAAGAGAAVPAVALQAASSLVPASPEAHRHQRTRTARWLIYALLRIPRNPPTQSTLKPPRRSAGFRHPSEAAPAADAKRQLIP